MSQTLMESFRLNVIGIIVSQSIVPDNSNAEVDYLTGCVPVSLTSDWEPNI